jgi:8-oxo-dGTP pyrophosphatase MutT (NUDIX family)
VAAVAARTPPQRDAVSDAGAGPGAGHLEAAAVLCALFTEGDQAEVVLTRRSTKLRSHTGEVSFPGGRMERGESPLDAARREAHEEVGLDPATVTPVGRLSSLTTSISPAPIIPIVATLPGRPVLHPNPDEVDRAFTVPLVALVPPEVHHSELWGWTDGAERRIDFFDLEGDTVWGATARMLSELLDWVALDATGAGDRP